MKRAIAVVAILTLSGAAFAQNPPEAPPQASPAPATETLKAAVDQVARLKSDVDD